MTSNTNPPQHFFLNAEKEWKEMDQKIRELSAWLDLSPYRKCKLRFSEPLRQAWVEVSLQESFVKINQSLNDLEGQIQEGSILSLRELIYIATEATRRLNQFAEVNPKFTSIAAESLPAWPTLYTGKTTNIDKVKTLTGKIGLASAEPPPLRNGNFDPRNAKGAPEWASVLFNSIYSVRVTLGAEKPPGRKWSFQTSKMSESLLLKINRKKVKFFEKRILNLPQINTCDYKVWWKVAKGLLAEFSGNRQWEIKGMQSYVRFRTPKSKIDAEKNKIDGFKRSDVNKAVESSFKTIFNQCKKYLSKS